MRGSKILATAFAVSLTIFSAAAQETGSLVKRHAAQMNGRSPTAARVTMREFAVCLASRAPARLIHFISQPVGSDQANKLSKNIFDRQDDQCLSSGELSFSPGIMRGAFFEAIYLKQYGWNVRTDFSSTKQSGYRALYSQPFSASAQNAIALEEYGECVVRANPRAARVLIGSYPDSALETSTFTELAPLFGPCLTKGEKIAFSKTVLRGVVAEGLYWLTVAPAVAQGALK